jgi:hypothetical protein
MSIAQERRSIRWQERTSFPCFHVLAPSMTPCSWDSIVQSRNQGTCRLGRRANGRQFRVLVFVVGSRRLFLETVDGNSPQSCVESSQRRVAEGCFALFLALFFQLLVSLFLGFRFQNALETLSVCCFQGNRVGIKLFETLPGLLVKNLASCTG